jgi:hypothetical protein
MRPFLWGDEQIAQVKSLRLHAETHPFTLESMTRMLAFDEKPAGEQPEFTRHFPFGFKLVFTHEYHPMKGEMGKDNPKTVLLRHMSMSVPKDGRFPNPEVVKLVIKELGYKNELENCYLTMRENAIVVMEEVDSPKTTSK